MPCVPERDGRHNAAMTKKPGSIPAGALCRTEIRGNERRRSFPRKNHCTRHTTDMDPSSARKKPPPSTGGGPTQFARSDEPEVVVRDHIRSCAVDAEQDDRVVAEADVGVVTDIRDEEIGVEMMFVEP